MCVCVCAGSVWVRNREGKPSTYTDIFTGENHFPAFVSVLSIKCYLYSIKFSNELCFSILLSFDCFKDNILWSHTRQSVIDHYIKCHFHMPDWLSITQTEWQLQMTPSLFSVLSPAWGWADKSETNPSSWRRENYTHLLSLSPFLTLFVSYSYIKDAHCQSYRIFRAYERNPIWVGAGLELGTLSYTYSSYKNKQGIVGLRLLNSHASLS